MAGPYGSTSGVKDLLETDGENVWAISQESRIVSILATVSALIEQETGVVFGESDPETIVIDQYGPLYHRLLYLPKGLRSLDSVTRDPEWVSGAWSGGTVLTTSEYRLASLTVDGFYRSLYGVETTWGGRYLVTGLWEDQVSEVPAEINYLANYLSAEIFKKQKASPAGFVGPDSAVVPIRNTFNEPEVKKILDMHRVNCGVMFF